MSKYTVSIINHKDFGNMPFAEIKDANGNIVYKKIASYLRETSLELLNIKINEIQNFLTDPNININEEIEEIGLINGFYLRNAEGQRNIFELYNEYESDSNVDVVSREDLIYILEAWKEALEKYKEKV